jgi:transposase
MRTNPPTPHEVREESSFLQPLQIGCGLDVHSKNIEACIMAKGKPAELRSFGTTTKELRALVEWIVNSRVETVAIESTGIYWYGIYQLITESGIEVKLLNAARVKQIPGKKTDTADCKWLCKLLMNGLVEGSFIPAGPHRHLRELTRLRFKYVNLSSQVENRIIKILERANIKIRSVMSNITTKSGMAITRALAEGETDIDKLVDLCKGKLRRKAARMREALDGLLTDQDREQLRFLILDQVHYSCQIASVEERMKNIVNEHFAQAVEIVDSIHGVGVTSAMSIIAEIGDDMKRFETADKLTSWSGLSPGNKESGGKRKNVRIVKGNRYIKPILVQIAWTAVRSKTTYWSAQFFALSKRMPAKKAIIAIARKMLRMIHSLLLAKQKYLEIGAQGYWDQIKAFRQARPNPGTA